MKVYRVRTVYEEVVTAKDEQEAIELACNQMFCDIVDFARELPSYLDWEVVEEREATREEVEALELDEWDYDDLGPAGT